MPGGFPRGFSYPPGGYPPMAVPLSVPGQAAVVPQTPQAPTSTLGTAPEAGAGGPAELRAQAAHPTGAPAAFEETKLLAPKEGAPPGAGKEEVASGTKHGRLDPCSLSPLSPVFSIHRPLPPSHPPTVAATEILKALPPLHFSISPWGPVSRASLSGSDSPASPDRPTKAARSSSPLPAPTAPPGAATALLSQPSPSSFVPADTPSAPGTSPSQLPPAPHQLPLPWSAAGMPPPPPPPLPGAPFVGAMMPPYAPPFYPPAMMMMRPPPPPPPSAPPPPAMQAPTSTRPPPGVASGANSIPVAVRPGLALPTANTPSPPPLPMTSAADYSPAAAGPLPGPRAPLAWTPPPPPPLPVPVPAVHPPEDDASPRAAQPGETATRNGGSGGIVGPARPPTTISAPPRLVGGAPSAPALPHTGVVEKPAFVPSTVLLKRAAAPTMRRPRTHAHPAAGASAAGAGLPAISAAPDVALPGAPVAPTQADASTAATADADYEQFMKDMKELGAI